MNSTILNLLNKTKINTDIHQEVKKYALGEVIADKYEVLDKLSISTSGESDIYKVKSLENNKDLVVKVFRRNNSSKNDVLDKIKNINNKNVGQILEYGDIDGFTYIVMPFYKNDSLEKLITNGIKLDKESLKPILESIIDGLNAMHEAEILHKDLKPANMMISDDGSHIILIDFGISSSTNGKTVVATQTGKTPFYSAPETYTNLFLKESDYYSLGITIYELITGSTPYQNTNIENLQQYQQIQQIPFPDGFDEELKDLISALTYKDISYRNDKSNPNRRWVYEEIKKWLKGEKQPIPGSAQTSNVQTFNQSQIPYIFKGKKYFNLTELVKSFLSNWNEGKSEVFRNHLSRHFELIDDKAKLERANKAAEEIEKDASKSDSIFFDLMYRLAPEIKQFCWQGYFFESVYDYGDKLLNEILEKNADAELLKTSQNPIVLEKLEWFAHHANENPETYAKIIANLKTLLTTEPLEIKLNAMRVGYALTNKESLKIGDTVFETINDFNSFLEDLYNSNLLKYRDFCIKNDSQIKEIAKLFSGEKKKQFEKNLISNKQTIEIGKIKKFYFRDYEEIARYVNLLWNNNRLEEFHFFTINCIEEIRTVIEERNLKNIFNEYLSNVSSYLCINEYIFKDIPEFKNYWEHLSKRQRKEFVDSHGNAIDEALSKRPVSDRNIIDSLLEQDLKTTHNLNDFKVGNIVTLGNFGGPIEWQVLEVKDNKALLLSKHILFRTAYDINHSGTWKTSSLRQYLNGKFYENCFTKSEKNAIISSNIKVNSGDTKDRIYLLSVDEVNKYFKNDQERIAVSLDGCYGYWWLRCRGYYGNYAACVHYDGDVYDDGHDADVGAGGVRVALQWNLQS